MRALFDLIGLLVATLPAVNLVCAQSPIQGVDPASGPVASILVISGVVQRANPEEDTPLPPDLRIFVDCHHGNFYDGGNASLSGQFRFTMTPDPLAIAAASICAIEAKAFGYESSIARFPERSSSGVINVGALTIQRTASGETLENTKEHTSQTVSATSLRAPPEAIKLFDRGARAQQQGKFSAAVKDFESATKLYPDYAEAWLNLGRARESLNSLGPARDAFLRAATLDPQMAGPPAELGLLLARQNDLAGAVKYLDESLRLDPAGSYQACYSDAIVNLMLKRYEVAEQSARAALRFGDSGPQVRVNYVLGMTLLARGNNSEAKKRLERYLELVPQAPDRDQVQKELTRLEKVAAAN
jgi:tetratricopeptide (TPR) repeat protein